MLALRAVLVAATSRVALALPASSRNIVDLASGKEKYVAAAVTSESEGRRRGLERLQDDTESGGVSLAKQRRLRKERSLWLGGKSRQALTNYYDVQYVGFTEIGGQTISGIFDTGSFELVVFSKLCSTCGEAGRYDPAFSANHTEGRLTSSLMYGSGNVITQEAFDTVSVGPYAPRNQSFWEVTDANMPALAHSLFQAIIGLGPSDAPLAEIEDRLRMVHDIMSNFTNAGLPVPAGLVESEAGMRGVALATRAKTTMVETFELRMFSICLGRQPGSLGYVIWGDTAPLVKPEYFQRLRMTGNHTWSTSLDEPKFEYDPAAKDRQFDRGNKYHGRTLGCENGCGALLDTGTSILAMPSSVLAELYKVMYEPGFNCSNLWELPSIKIQLGGREVILPPDTYVSEVFDSDAVPGDLQSFVRLRHLGRLRSAKGQASQQLGHSRGSESQRPGASCDFAVMESVTSSAHGPLWILGVPFFRQYYTTFEVGGHSNERRAVHFARASDACTPSASEGFDQFVPKTQLYSRLIHPSKLWVPPSVLSALGADYVNL